MLEFVSRLGRRFLVAELKQAYTLVFRTVAGERFVLPDLAEFCYAYEPSPRGGDLFVQGRAAGRRDVWLHIREPLDLTEDELSALLRGRSLPKQGD
jgi:hypothetical protein